MTGESGADDAGTQGLQDLAVEERQAYMDRFVAGDYLLTDLVDMANAGVGVWVTLAVRGQLVTGRLASSDEYFNHAAQMVAGGFTGDFAHALRARVNSNRPATNASPALAGMPPSYVHLVDARYVLGNGELLPPNGTPAIVWRGKIASVDGFSIGRFMPK